jgi:hypothetical protein
VVPSASPDNHHASEQVATQVASKVRMKSKIMPDNGVI